MAVNEFGVALDHNGYAPSILHDGECYLCCTTVGRMQRHEVFGGARRQESKALGLWLTLCPDCHEQVHHFAEEGYRLKRWAQRVAMERYEWSAEEFMRRIGKNYAE